MEPWQKKARDNEKVYKRTLQNTSVKDALKRLPELHDKAFEKINCLSCAACCKTYSPRFTGPEIRRIAKRLAIKETEFIATYLMADTDGDYVLQKQPCSFLLANNECSIYDIRPADCRRFPYTDEDVFVKKPKLTLKNLSFCPIVYSVLEDLTQIKKKG